MLNSLHIALVSPYLLETIMTPMLHQQQMRKWSHRKVNLLKASNKMIL